MNRDLSDLRINYDLEALTEKDLPDHPMRLFENWFIRAENTEEIMEPNAMTLATADEYGHPSARIVLLKAFREEGFLFYTNYTSKKGRQLRQNKKAALVFLWKVLHRQVRIQGDVFLLAKEESEDYFRSRPRSSQIGAWVSNQSQILNDRATLESAYNEFEKKYQGKEIPLPDFWGGYILKPTLIEFWQGRESRLHERILYEKKQDSWNWKRLYP
jgi:pyridoxamine 5'-phosphate oxidase